MSIVALHFATFTATVNEESLNFLAGSVRLLLCVVFFTNNALHAQFHYKKRRMEMVRYAVLAK